MAAADKLNGAYWRKRAIELAEKQKQEDDDLCLRFHREYERILHELDKEISIFYARYAANESVSMADARRLLRDAELKDFRMSLDEFRDKALAGGFDKELEEVYLRSRISRLQVLQTQVELRMMELFGSQRDVLRDHLQERYTDTYYHFREAFEGTPQVVCQAEDFDGVVLVKDITAEGFLYCLRTLQTGSYYTGAATGTSPAHNATTLVSGTTTTADSIKINYVAIEYGGER